jgi:hypothetical protein
MKKLIATKMSRDVIPSGGGVADGVRFLATPGAMKEAWSRASDWVKLAIQSVRNAAEPNQWKNATDEEIAGELLLQIQARKAQKAPHSAGQERGF